MIYRLANPVRSYPWGSTSVIPDLLGRLPTGQPQAELWMGAHPSGPSMLEGGGSLLDRIATDPAGELGTAALAEFGPRLPFLVKVLAAAAPLSIQAHPTMSQAAAGFAAEDARGVPLDAPDRNYKDASHKPELLCALHPFRALAGFRAVPETVRLLAGLEVEALAPYLAMLRDQPGPAGLRQVVTAMLLAPAAERTAAVDAVAAACRAHQGGEFAAERRTVLELAERYPGDAGVLVALLLNYVELAPGEALFLPAGNPHAYLAGTGVEIMANSDNVLRGGLTGKHIDVLELLQVLDFTPGPPPLVDRRTAPDGEQLYPAPVREFRLTRLVLASDPSTVEGGQPQIMLCVEGSVEVSTVDGNAVMLARGESGYLPASEAKVILSGPGVLFRATPQPRVMR